MTAPLFDLPEPARPEPARVPGPGRRGSVRSVIPAASPAPDREVTFLHTADWQLGMTRHFLGTESAHTYAAARQEAIARIGQVATDSGAEFVGVCGDVFEDHRVSTRTIRQTLDRLAEFSVPVFLLPGNHDPFDAAGIYRSRTFRSSCPDNVTVLSTPGVHRVREGIELVAAPWSHKQPPGDLLAAQIGRLERSEDAIRIAVGHGGVDTISPGSDPALVSVAGLESAIADGLVDYVALGDRHSTTQVGDTGRIWYPGAHEVTNFDHIEERPGQVLEVRLRRGSINSADVTPHQVGQWTFRSIRHDVTGLADIDGLRAELDAITDKPRTVVQLALVGAVSITEHAALESVLEDHADRFAALVRWPKHDDLVVTGDAADVDDLGLSGYAADAARELIEQSRSTDADTARAARDALGLLRRLAGSGR